MARLTVQGLQKYYGKVHALRGIDLDIQEGEFCVFVGPSGCGKIHSAAHHRRARGHRRRHDRLRRRADGAVCRRATRNIAMVFQNYALYPYLNVFENIAFGLRRAEVRARRGPARGSTAPPPCWASASCSSACRASCPAASASGWRSAAPIVRDARLFLFDEPLSNLDAQLRDGMRAEIKRLHQEIGKTTVYVTHDQIEAMTLADRIVLLKDGVIEQQGAPLDLFERPATRFVAGFLGSPQMNFVPCRLEEAALHFSNGPTLPLPPAKAARLEPWRGRAMTLGIRPEHFSRADAGAPRAGQVPLRVTVDLVQPTGTRTYATFKLGGAEVSAELPAHTVETPGTELDLLADLDRAILIDPQTDRVA